MRMERFGMMAEEDWSRPPSDEMTALKEPARTGIGESGTVKSNVPRLGSSLESSCHPLENRHTLRIRGILLVDPARDPKPDARVAALTRGKLGFESLPWPGKF
ncbi:hypothetical protein BTVI_01986 [Pitangus sulphuratus]|nr:hypothetical protein BTVI_01986 [Pitangus sulphuratus]